jgi:MFS family permease
VKGHASLLVITLCATQVGRLGDIFGRVRMYEAGILVFIVGSALCALAAMRWLSSASAWSRVWAARP